MLRVDDTLLWDLWLSRQQLIAVAVADELHFFELLNEGADTLQQLAEKSEISIQGSAALTGILAALGFINKHHDDVTLKEVSRTYLLPQSPLYWGAALTRARENPEYHRVLKALQGDRAASLDAGANSFSDQWGSGQIEFEAAKQFTSIMHCTIFSSAVSAIKSGAFEGITHLVDVGGGSGCYARAFVNHYPHAKATIFELPNVCEVAKSYATKKDDETRITLQAGNFFQDPLPREGDGILLSNILHDWTPSQAQLIINNAYEASPAGGKIFIHEMLLNDEKNGPLAAMSFNLLMYVNHRSQQFTKQELFSLLEHAGYKRHAVLNVHPYYSLIIGQK